MQSWWVTYDVFKFGIQEIITMWRDLALENRNVQGGKESKEHSVHEFSAAQGDNQESDAELLPFHVKECYV